jgi:CRP/FNR family transcriptional regulator, anaerobic regulatory protein
MLDYSEMYGLSQITLGTFRNMVNLLSETAYENQQMIKVLVQPDAFLKVTSFILLMAERNKIKFFTEDNFSLPLTQKDLSSLLGISPVTLRRVLDKLERDVGGITIHDRKVVIKDIAQVRRSIRLHLMS